ncbi:hypothetical protein [Amycolatopsis sp. NPDC003861]
MLALEAAAAGLPVTKVGAFEVLYDVVSRDGMIAPTIRRLGRPRTHRAVLAPSDTT